MKKKKTFTATRKNLLLPQYATSNGTGYKVHLIVTDDVEAYVRWHFPDMAQDAMGAIHIYTHFESYIILPNDASISTVVHECWHCVFRIFKDIKADGLDNETVAYTIGWLTEVASRFLYTTPEYQKAAKEFLKKTVDAKKKKK